MTWDHRDLDGRLLELLLAVLEEGSITRAAARLGVTQSAVSHLLDKLRAITGDALFVKSGRGIVATARAEALGVQARDLLDQLRRLATSASFDASQLQARFTLAANDLQRDLLLPALLRRLRAQAPGVTLHVMPSDVPSSEMLRDQHCQLVISPRPPEGSDILQKRLFTDHYRVFYDPAQRQAPATLADYLASEHVSVLYHQPRRTLDVDDYLLGQGLQRRIIATVPGFAGLPALLRGSATLATAPSLLRSELMRDFASAAVPTPTPELPMYLVWHLRHQADPVHQWLRHTLESVVTACSALQASDSA
jgi:DNA-binding transcriptional LysR family regulator